MQQGQRRRQSRANLWQKDGPVSLNEMKGFIAVFLNMGLIKKTGIKEYWSKMFPSQITPWFGEMFSLNRFLLILKFLHLVNNDQIPHRQDPNYDPAAKFKPLIQHANMMFQRYRQPRREVAVDESLVSSRGRSVMRQYIPSKVGKYGIKLWMICEAVTGYVLHIITYRGRRFDPTPPRQSQGLNVVMSLLQSSNLLNKNYHVFTDGFFSSINLARQLLMNNTFFTGTLRKNKPMPNVLRGDVPEGEHYFRQGSLLLCAKKERGKKPVRLLSSWCSANNAADGKPEIISEYNKFMGGVDISDMKCSFYDDKRKTMKVWKKVMFNIFHRMMLNAYILYEENTDAPMTRLRFIQSVIEDLSAEQYNHRKEIRQARLGRNDLGRFAPRHQAGHRELRRLPGRKEKNCVVCSIPANRRRSRTVCTTCNHGVHPLCLQRHRNCGIEI